MKLGTVNSPDGLRVRSTNSTAGARLGLLPHATTVRIVETRDGWHRIALSADCASDTTVSGWVSAAYVLTDTQPPLPPPQPPPTLAAAVRVGLNVLNRHNEVALPAAARGCRYFIVLDNPGLASRLKREYPDAVVMVRAYWNRRVPGVDEAIARLGGCGDPGLIYTGLNEGDECGQDEDGIRRRAAFDAELARRIKQISGATYAAGTFSMGTPDFTRPSVCEVVREVYAPHYNSGLLSWDHHLYSPTMQFGTSAGIDPIWFETRWRFLFTHCGFDPASPSRVYCSETGVDEGGVGGFPAHWASDADVVRWAKWWREIQAEQLLGQSSPFVGGAIFQAGNREDWAGYNVEGHIDALAREVWR